jgi:4-alpha-glucanotransferase
MTAPKDLDERASLAGIADGYWGIHGEFVPTPSETKQRLLGALAPDDRDPAMAAAPAMRHEGRPCYLPAWIGQQPAWGITLQLYELRSGQDWGIGDFHGLAQFARIAARRGADFVGMTPLHAPLMAEPARCSPFSPSNRRFLNPLHIAVEEVPGWRENMADRHEIERLRRLELIDYPAVARLKLDALRKIREIGAGADAEFDAFRRAGGEALDRHALFEALSFEMVRQGHGAGWITWPADFHDPRSPAVAEFARAHADEVTFHAWLQFIADTQLASAAREAEEAGMRIGLYVDLAVGEAHDGSAVWSDRAAHIGSASVGAPPDYFTSEGQHWGIAALSPAAMREDGYRGFEALIERASRHAGALRIDHVMALWQLFMIPDGMSASQGAHVRYPMEDLLAVLAEHSQRNGLIVIGEDLGHVPEGFRDVMNRAAILSYRILYFEKAKHGAFLPAENWPASALACVSTHDLPTLEGWWRGKDVDLRLDHGLIDEASASEQAEVRRDERAALLRAVGSGDSHAKTDEPPPGLAEAVHGFLADTPSMLAAVRLADLAGEREPTNLPGTSDAYPNWRRRCPVPIEAIEAHPLFASITETMARRRRRA